jgi:hypothetical protein
MSSWFSSPDRVCPRCRSGAALPRLRVCVRRQAVPSASFCSSSSSCCFELRTCIVLLSLRALILVLVSPAGSLLLARRSIPDAQVVSLKLGYRLRFCSSVSAAAKDQPFCFGSDHLCLHHFNNRSSSTPSSSPPSKCPALLHERNRHEL